MCYCSKVCVGLLFSTENIPQMTAEFLEFKVIFQYKYAILQEQNSILSPK